MTVDPRELIVKVEMNAVYMNDQILTPTLDGSLPGTHWPAPTTARAKSYVLKWITLQLDGHPLEASDFTPRFIQEPLGVQDPRLVFTIRYPIVDAVGKLRGRMAFFEESRLPEAERAKRADHMPPQTYMTYLAVVGNRTIRFELPIEKPDFEISLDGLARSQTARTIAKLATVGGRIVVSPLFWFVLIFMIVRVINRMKQKRVST